MKSEGHIKSEISERYKEIFDLLKELKDDIYRADELVGYSAMTRLRKKLPIIEKKVKELNNHILVIKKQVFEERHGDK